MDKKKTEHRISGKEWRRFQAALKQERIRKKILIVLGLTLLIALAIGMMLFLLS